MLTYTVQPGDTLSSIAQRFNTTVEKLVALNNISDPDHIDVGMVLTIEADGDGGAGGDPVAARVVDGLLYVLSTDRRTYRQGEPVRLTLIKVNIQDSPITMTYATGQRFDFAALREGREVWRWSFGRSFPQIAGQVTLQPGESQTFRATWDQRNNAGNLVAPGNFTIRGFNVARGLAQRFVSIPISVAPAVVPTPPPPTGVCPTGNLLRDPGLEEWRDVNTPVLWNGTNIFRTPLNCGGRFAAGMGAVPNRQATLTQSVAGLPGRLYQLSFSAREIPGRPPRGNFSLEAAVFFYDAQGRLISRADPVFSETSIPESCRRFSLTTGLSPARTGRVEVRFIFTPAAGNNNPVAVDEVDLRCI
jgi:LysM repeat protein